MILGIGSDIVDIRRIEHLLRRHGARFLARVYDPAEIAAAEGRADRVAYLARRFAAREAAAKALGSGFRDGVSWRDVRVDSDDLGRPRLHLSGGAERRLRAITPAGHAARLHLSLSDEPPMAVAFVVIEAVPLPSAP
ncbi:MAG TPA: holo-ACP synthase [Thermopetrobacter sp.]|nr:holo-ACP synthase [Thermopetrobacter sp.]